MGRLQSLAKLKDFESLNQAAGKPGRQAQFSRQIRELEDASGLHLVDRSSLRLRLTRKGHEVVRLYEQLVLALNGGRVERLDKEIVIGGGELALVNWVIPLLSSVINSLTETIRFRNMRSLDALQGYQRGEVDIVVSSFEPELAKGEGRARRISQGGYLVVGGRCQGVSPGIELAEVVKQPLVLLEGKTPVRLALEEEAARQGRDLRVAVLCSTYEQVLTAVRVSDWLGVVPGICQNAAKNKGLGARPLLGDAELDFALWVLCKHPRRRALARVLRALQENRAND